WALDEARKAEVDAGVSAQLRGELFGVFEELIRCPNEVLDAELRDRVGWALLEKAKALEEEERFEDALNCIAELLARFRESSESEMVDRLASALEWKAYLFGRLSRFDEQLAVYENLVDRFRDSIDPSIRQRV